MSVNKNLNRMGFPKEYGLYNPKNEHENCGFGFIANIKNEPKHEIVHQALEIVHNLDHRGAVGSDPLAGDGAGILIQIPDLFFRKEFLNNNVTLPKIGDYGVGMVFFPSDKTRSDLAQKAIENTIAKEGQVLIGWRDVPVDDVVLGESVKENAPLIRQFFVQKGINCIDEKAFQRKLYVIRKQAHSSLHNKKLADWDDFYIVSLSTRTIIFKGMVLAPNLSKFYVDFQDKDFKTAIALFHQRFSTNTFPSWRLAQPFRYLCHNGEINTVKGNINWMNARRHNMKSDVLKDDLEKLWPIIEESPSDSSTFDNALELLVMGGYSLPHAMMLMIPEAWKDNELMDVKRKSFYEYYSALMEPWDGPAAMAFTDGIQIAATLDRNGLRPARYIITEDDLVIMSSEVGVLQDIPEEKIVSKWRLQPGKMLVVDLDQKRIISDKELKDELTNSHPYQEWLDNTQINLSSLPPEISPMTPESAVLLDYQQAFGYNKEDLKFFLEPMIVQGQDPIASMGRDIPLAALSDKNRLLYDYFFQNFAQVTNPPIDPIREELVMSLVSFIGPRPNLLDLKSGGRQKRLEVDQPILTNMDLERIRRIENHFDGSFKTYTLSICYKKNINVTVNMEQMLIKLCKKAEELVRANGYNIIILSDRKVDKEHMAIPALLATSAVHHHLIKKGLRTEVGIVVETGEAKRVHDLCLLAGYGAEAINPYLAFYTLSDIVAKNHKTMSEEDAHKKYVKAVSKGMLKVMSKMGISTYQSYCGAQIFDAVGLSSRLIDNYFCGTSSKVEGIGIEEIQSETENKHELAFGDSPLLRNDLDIGGDLSFRLTGEEHVWTPETIGTLQHAVRSANYKTFKKYTKKINDQSVKLKNLRGLFKFKESNKSINIDEVEPVSEIVKRFATGAMSLGSISTEAHTTLAIAMNRLGGRSNTGEGGEESSRFKPLPNGDSMNSRIKQVASGRFGVTTEYLSSATDIQIKMAQGAKPGEGGQLPGDKVNDFIAKIRHSTPGVGLISPPPHHDIYSIEDLAQLIHDLKNVNPEARISVKLVSEIGVGTVAAGVSKAYADHVTISGHDGGTGASPITSLLNAGGPWETGLAEAHQTLVMNGLRERIAVQVDGGLRTGRDVIIGAILGADEFGFATAALISEGCIMMRKCHLNTCPVGVATQDPELRKNFTGLPEHVVNFFVFIANEVREILAELGIKNFNDIIGRRDLLNYGNADDHWKAHSIDLSKLIVPLSVDSKTKFYNCSSQNHQLEKALDNILIDKCINAINKKQSIELALNIKNTNRTVGAMLSGKIAKKYGHEGLPKDTIKVKFVGSAGQSFGAWLSKGITFNLEGDANDYVGKGLSGGKIAVYPHKKSSLIPEKNIIAGNTLLYGAISGECYLNGIVGERFAVRNSGATAVVEGCGDHGCEYMTGGVVVILGKTGRNFAAGMSGGIAYVLDEDKIFEGYCNKSMVDLELLSNNDDDTDDEVEINSDLLNFDVARLKLIIKNHVNYTESSKGKLILSKWDKYLPLFLKITPFEYKRALNDRKNKLKLKPDNNLSVRIAGE
ncbi:glutamate synthase large subunit [Alphaproteobacteria bacterium]|jgi:glutamate synthase (NADPH/NADH) large chain|nr:glutamate synthase large subunit [Alphaproteobacteria bacterium]|tara:strand:- start:920 stop:5563 length:4644 start_codon:yes stop_codon:yes gene_type:complete